MTELLSGIISFPTHAADAETTLSPHLYLVVETSVDAINFKGFASTTLPHSSVSTTLWVVQL